MSQPVHVRVVPVPSATSRDYLVCGCTLRADAPLRALEGFIVAPAASQAHAGPVPPIGASPEWKTVFAGRAWVGGDMRLVMCEQAADVLRVGCAESRDFLIGPGGAWIVAEPLASEPLQGCDEEVLIGPALLLALAQRGTLALHASAVATPRGVVAVVGESGAGKSTLAAPAGPEWVRVADDILPFGLVEGEPVVLPHYPQLKLPDTEQWPRSAPGRLPLAAL